MSLQITMRGYVSRFIGILDDFIAIVIAAFLIIRYQVKSPPPSESELLVGVLAVLTLIAFSGLRDRVFRFRKIEERIDKTYSLLEMKVINSPRADEFFKREDDPEPSYFEKASSIDILGITLGNTTRELAHVLGHRLSQGSKIRIILLDNSDEVLNQVVLRSWGQTTPDYYRKRLETSIRLIEIIAETPRAKGSLEIGFLPFFPSFGIKMIDAEGDNGSVFIEIYHHCSGEPSPSFYLKEDVDPYWFNFFKEQFDFAWKLCKVKSITNNA